MKTPITVTTTVNAPVAKTWDCFTNPEHITQWNFASSDWCCPHAVNDLVPGGRLLWRMEAKDGTIGFDLKATYQRIIPQQELHYTLEDGRQVRVLFTETQGRTQVTETFEPENQNPPEMQQEGWQAILENFRLYTENQ